mgnify:CR=1 FL=1|jgi:Fe-S cluster assembly iron-binding protein IscA
MSNIKLDKNTVRYFEDKNISKIKIFFYESWCSWTKVDISDDFKIDDNLVQVETDYLFDLYIEKKDQDKFMDCNITRTVKADHTWKEKIRYIFSNEKVKDRCGCGSSFSFDKKEIKIDLSKLKDMKLNIKTK